MTDREMRLLAAYHDARVAYRAADRAHAELADFLRTFAKHFSERPDKVCFANCSAMAPLGISIDPASLSFDATRWPTADAIQDIIGVRHATRDTLEMAWANLPAELRDGTEAPPR